MAEQKEIKVLSVVKEFKGSTMKNNKVLELKLSFAYTELVNFIQLVQMLNENVSTIVQIEDQKIKLGEFTIWELKVSHDGDSVLKLVSQIDYCFPDNINKLAGQEFFKILFKAKAEVPDSEE